MAKQGYSVSQKLLHWLIALLFGANYIVSDGMGRYLHDLVDKGVTSSDWVLNFHIFVGIGFLIFATIRIINRWVQKAPALNDTGIAKLDRATPYVHSALYLLMLFVPAAGLIAWYGKVDWFGDVHVIAMNLMLGLVGLHIAGALFHKFVMKDDTLHRMSLGSR